MTSFITAHVKQKDPLIHALKLDGLEYGQEVNDHIDVNSQGRHGKKNIEKLNYK